MTLPATRNTTKQAPQKMPAWLLRHLETKTGGFRKARWKRCPDCHDLIIEGLDNDIAAIRTRCDPTPLTPTQEGWCAIHARRTYALEIVAKAITIWARDPLDITTPSRQPITPEHVCGMRYPGFLLRPPLDTGHTDQAPPF